MKEASTETRECIEILKAGNELSSAEDITAPDVPEDILFPDELNRYLRDRVQVLIIESKSRHSP